MAVATAKLKAANPSISKEVISAVEEVQAALTGLKEDELAEALTGTGHGHVSLFHRTAFNVNSDYALQH